MSIIMNILTEFDGKGVKKAQAAFKNLETTTQKAQYLMKQWGGPAITASVGFLTAQLGLAVRAAAEDQKSQEQLKIALENTVGSTKAQTAAVEDSITALMYQTATADEQLRPALAQLVRATGDVSRAQTLLKLSTDIAAGSGRDLASVTNALSKAAMGQFGALKRLGIPLDETAVKTKDLDAIVGDLSRSFSGAAAKNAQTFAGQMKTLKLVVGELQESVGRKLIPILSDYATVLVSLTTHTGGAESSTKKWFDRLVGIGTWVTSHLTPLAALIPIFKGINGAVKDEATSLQQNSRVTSNVTKNLTGLNEASTKVSKAIGGSSTAHSKATAAAKAHADALAKAKAKAQEAAQQFQDLGNAIKENLSAKISEATTTLSGLQGEFDSFAGSVKSAVLSSFNFGSAQGDATSNANAMKVALEKQATAQIKVSDASAAFDRFNHPDNLQALIVAQRELADATNDVADASTKPTTFFDNLAKQAQKAKDFGVLINRLVAAGLSPEALSQVMSAGSDAGSAIATEILGSADGVLKANTLTKNLTDLADTIAQNAATHYYGAGVSAAAAFLKGLNDTMASVNITFADPKQTQASQGAANFFNPFSGVQGMGTLMADGGIVTRPTTITAGEAGPEAIIPLSKMGSMGGMGGGVTINVNGGDPQSVVDALRTYMRQNGSIPIKVSNIY